MGCGRGKEDAQVKEGGSKGTSSVIQGMGGPTRSVLPGQQEQIVLNNQALRDVPRAQLGVDL